MAIFDRAFTLLLNCLTFLDNLGGDGVTLGEKIRAARLERRLTQEQLAGRDFTKSYISDIERGVRIPRLPVLKILARRLRYPLSYFSDGASEETESEAFLAIGLAGLGRGTVDQARIALERAWELASQQADDALQARVELALAEVEQRQGNKARAARRAERAIGTLSRTGGDVLLAKGHICVGSLRLEGGDPVSAQWAFEAALQFAKQRSVSPLLLATLYWYIGLTCEKLGQTSDSYEAFRLACDVAESTGDHKKLAEWYLERATTAVEAGEFDEATRLGDRALVLFEAIRHKQLLAEIHEHLGDLELAATNRSGAEYHYRWSVVYYCACANIRTAGKVFVSLIELVLRAEAPETARALSEVALGVLPTKGEGEEWAHILSVRGVLYRMLGRTRDARASFEESLGLFEELGCQNQSRLMRQHLALLAVEANDLEEAHRQLMLLCETGGPGSWKAKT